MRPLAPKPNSRTARIFLSSTFRDFGEERDLLIRKVFPALRARLRDRFVELVDVDLRWGITAEQAERGEVLPICLAEIDRSRPFFVGLLGERYGWVPDEGSYPADLVEQRKWLKRHRGERSVTELEILHGVLNNPKMAGNALFYFRSAAYARKKGGDYLAAGPEDRARQHALKQRIRESGFPVVESYRDPEAFAKRLEKDLWAILDSVYPADEVPDAFTRESARHEAYAVPRRRLYLGGEGYINALVTALDKGSPRILIEGASGGGKSALLANALGGYRARHKRLLMLEHYLGASSDAAAAPALARRLVEFIQRTTQSSEAIPGDPQALFESLPTWFAIASAWAQKHRTRWVFVLDALNGLSGHRDLRWLPEYLPAGVQLVVSCLDGEVKNALVTKGAWARIRVKPLTAQGRKELLRQYLARYNKVLPADLERRALRYPLANNPLWLKTLAEELRLFGSHEALGQRLHELLSAPKGKAPDEAPTVDDLFEHVITRVEGDHGRARVRDALTAIWASRAGLSEKELLEVLAPHAPVPTKGKGKSKDKGKTAPSLAPALWAPIRLALDDMLLESAGRLVFAHDYARIAVRDRDLPTWPRQRAAHRALATFFEARAVDARVAEELPWQWQAAKVWGELRGCLTRVEMFEGVVEHRDEDELLGYWLAIEAARGGKLLIEESYKRAWEAWRLPRRAEATADVAGQLADFMRHAGRGLTGSFATGLSKLALDIVEKAQGQEHPSTATRLNNLAMLLQAQGDYAAAEPLYRRALAIAEKAEGPEHRSTGTRLNNLAGLLRDQGNYAAAEPMYRRALAIGEKAQGPEHPLTGSKLSNLAGLLQEQGDYAAAEPLFRRALAIAEKARGPEHPETGGRLNNLALLLTDQGDYAAAEPLYRRALAIAVKAQGPEHPLTGTTLNNLALLLLHQSDYAAAEPLFRRALAIAEKAQGPEHPETGTRLNNLALLLRDQGDYAAAEPLYRRALAIGEKAQGPEHPETGMSLGSLAGLLRDQGDYAAAEPLFRRALAIAEKAQGPEHPGTGTTLCNLAGLLQDQGDYAAAEPLYRRALAIAEKARGPEHPGTGTTLRNLAGLLQEQGDYAAAEPLYRRALAIAEKAQGPEHPSTGASLNNLATLLLHQSDYAAAEPLYRRALAIAEKAQGPEHPATGMCLNNLAALLLHQSDYAAAEPLFHRALAIAEKTQGPEHPSTGMSLNNLAGVLYERGDYAAAEPLYRRALAIAEKAQGPEHPSAGTSLNNLAGLLQEQGNYAAAEPLFRRALAIADRAWGSDAPQTGAALYALASCLVDLDRSEEAISLFQRELEIISANGDDASDGAAYTRRRLGVLLRDSQRFEEAAGYLTAALQAYESLHGHTSTDVATCLNCLGQNEAMWGDFEAAAKHFREALRVRRAVAPEDAAGLRIIEDRLNAALRQEVHTK